MTEMTENKQSNNTSFNDACHFIIKLGERIHSYGPNAYRIEFYLNKITKALGYKGVFRSTPTEINFAFSEDGIAWQKTHVSSMGGTGTELNRMANVGELINKIEKGTISLYEANKRLDEIDALPHPWGNMSSALSFIMCGAAFPVLLGGTWWDVTLSGVFSLVVFLMTLFGGKGLLSGEWIPFSSAFVVGLLTAIARMFLPEINGVIIVVSSILVLIPGYPISVGIVEIVSKHINSGLSNLVSGLIYLFKQFLGGYLGVILVKLLATFPETTSASGVDPIWLWLFIPLIIVGLGIALQTPFRDFLWASLAMLVAYLGTVYGSEWMGSNFGNLLGTVLLVVFTNSWTRITKRPPSIVLVPAFILLVSGSIGFRGLAAMTEGNLQTGTQQFIQMFIVATTMAIGIFVGNSIIKSDK